MSNSQDGISTKKLPFGGKPGRPPGRKNKLTLAREQMELRAMGGAVEPNARAYLIGIMEDPTGDKETKLKAAIALMPYQNYKMGVIDPPKDAKVEQAVDLDKLRGDLVMLAIAAGVIPKEMLSIANPTKTIIDVEAEEIEE